MQEVVVYNFGRGEITNRVTIRHAIEMICRGVAKAIETVDGEFYGPFPLPLALELTKYIFPKWMYQKKPKFSRKNVLKRDKYTCASCEGDADTFDHILPQSQGGKSDWLNGVAACFRCNQKKRNRTPEQAGMKLRFEPFEPLLVDIM
mgnify:CR=1 FL=1